MGCFSYLCATCEKPINSDSFSGEHCVLFLIEKGVILEWMQGQYDSYGRVFKVDTTNLGPHSDEVCQLWETRSWSGFDKPEHPAGDLASVCDLQFNSDEDSGIAAYHTECLPPGEHPIVSDGDPEQGWSDYEYTTKGPFRHEVPRDNGIITLPPGDDGITWTKAE